MEKTERKVARLILEDGNEFSGFSFGFPVSSAGEVVFNTGMTGYTESLTDPSYFGEILTLTFPLVGNYGVPMPDYPAFPNRDFESDRIQVRGLVVSDYSEYYSHWHSKQSLSDWLIAQQIPAISEIDTRALTQILREKGTMLGKIVIGDDIDFYDPNRHNLVSEVSRKEAAIFGNGKRRITLLDCGCKRSILTNLIECGFEILMLPWNADLSQYDFSALVISNGPGDPMMCTATIAAARFALENKIPTLGICLGNQILALAAGARTYKLKYGHRGQNQPVIDQTTGRCFITSQNHGFAVDDSTLPEDFQIWFTNLNDRTNEGLMHRSGRFMSVQFHPEAAPGPVDTRFIFDRFLEVL